MEIIRLICYLFASIVFAFSAGFNFYASIDFEKERIPTVILQSIVSILFAVCVVFVYSK